MLIRNFKFILNNIINYNIILFFNDISKYIINYIIYIGN